MELELYARKFKIVDCDQFTRSFYESEGIRQDTPDQYPEDPFV